MSPSIIWQLLDITRLGPDDIAADIVSICSQARGLYDPADSNSHAAAICCYPKFASVARAQLAGSAVKLAVVANFPDGDDDSSKVADAISGSIADEIDVVLPYKKFIAGAEEMVAKDLELYRSAAGGRCLKLILETAAFTDLDQLAAACQLAITQGVDFLKTSTGMGPGGASITAVRVLLAAILDAKHPVGIKVSGGVASIANAVQYLSEIKQVLGQDALVPSRVRIGASRLANLVWQHKN